MTEPMFDDNFENGLLEWKRIALFKVPPNANANLDDRMYRLDDSKKYQEVMALIKQKYFNVQVKGDVFSQIEVFASLPKTPEAAARLEQMAKAKADQRAGVADRRSPTGVAKGRWDRSKVTKIKPTQAQSA